MMEIGPQLPPHLASQRRFSDGDDHPSCQDEDEMFGPVLPPFLKPTVTIGPHKPEITDQNLQGGMVLALKMYN